LKSRPMSPAYFCHVSFMKMSILCLLKSFHWRSGGLTRRGVGYYTNKHFLPPLQ
jgi:hypothetical protein